ncbi:MAG: serine/threonine-protein kinase [Myxococcales bacterium]|nr:serine/threonine-protein kinase [Myxococcales bacterium]
MLTPHTPSGGPRTLPPGESLVGTVIAGKYRIRRLLGRGGMGAVYKAENMAIGRTVAVKVLHAHLADDGVALARFHREARAAASVHHPHVVEVLDLGVEPPGTPYLVMEYVRGKSLSRLLRTEGPLEPARAACIAGQVLAGLAALHDRGVVHRDLKPENVLLTVRQGRTDFVKVFDFGVAAFIEGVWEAQRFEELTPHGRAMGTPHYASPEQLEGRGVRDGRIDVYAVGVLLYEMLSGYRPFEAPDLAELCRRILHEPPAPLMAFRKDVPEGLEAVVRRALAKDPRARFDDAASMLEALVPFGAERPAEPEPEPTDTFTVDLRELRAREQLLEALRTGDSAPPPATESGNAALVRGEVIVAIAQFLRARIGVPLLRASADTLPERARSVVLGPLDPGSWYPEIVLDVLEAADRVAADGQRTLVAEAGRALATQLLGARAGAGTTGSLTPELFFSYVPDLWARYFTDGRARVMRISRGYGRLEVRERSRASMTVAVVLAGYVEEALRIVGARDVDVRLARAAALGDGSDVLEATWAS